MDIAFALTAFLVYGVVSLVVGERFVFSRYSMYARLSGRTVGAIPYIRAGTRWIDADQIDAVFGLDFSALDATGVPCSELWAVAEAERWLRSREVNAPEETFVPIDVGFRFIEITKDGVVDERVECRCQALARLRE